MTTIPDIAVRGSADPLTDEPSSDRPRALVLRAAGTNCDAETAHAFKLAGADAHTLHLNRIADDPAVLDDFDLLAIPGGFSYGDDIAAGRIFADRLVRQLREPLRRFVDRGRPVIGICNGFQVLVQTDLLPGPTTPTPDSQRPCALTWNATGRFQCRWVALRKVAPQCVWTADWAPDETVELPIAHAEGRLVCRDPQTLDDLRRHDRVALVYAAPAEALPIDLPANPSGSSGDIAGLCDATGLVLGLMPHPERFVDPFQHPGWARHRAAGEPLPAPAGLRLFQSALRHVRPGTRG